MKRNFLILAFALTSIITAAQADYFDDESAVVQYQGKYFQGDDYKSMVDFLANYYYLFESGGKLFMAAYDSTEADEQWKYNMHGTRMLRTRTLLLYRLDGGKWVKASDTIQVDYIRHNVPVIDFFLPEGHSHYGHINTKSNIIKKGLTGGSVKVMENGIVILNLENDFVGNPSKIHRVEACPLGETCDEKCKCCGISYSQLYFMEERTWDCNVLVFLIPNGDNTYTATRFEPELKKVNDAVLAAGQEIKVISLDDGFMRLELWNKVVCRGADCDGVVEIDGDGGVQKVPYSLKMSQKLYFAVNDDRTVDYVRGTAELIRKK